MGVGGSPKASVSLICVLVNLEASQLAYCPLPALTDFATTVKDQLPTVGSLTFLRSQAYVARGATRLRHTDYRSAITATDAAFAEHQGMTLDA